VVFFTVNWTWSGHLVAFVEFDFVSIVTEQVKNVLSRWRRDFLIGTVVRNVSRQLKLE
jgi:hypothetical protein